MYEQRKVMALIVAAGAGVRMGSPVPKQFMDIGGRPMVLHSAVAFSSHELVDEVYVAVAAGQVDTCKKIVEGLPKFRGITQGGDSRQETVLNSLRSIAAGSGPDDIVLIHDGARPWVDEATITNVIIAAAESGAAVPCVPVTETLYRATDTEGDGVQTGPGAGRFLRSAPRRENMFAVQTPQGFKLALILSAHEEAAKNGVEVTDDGIPAHLSGHEVRMVLGEPGNVKVTTARDMEMARAREGLSGIGFDVHPFAAGRRLILGGVDIPFDRGLDGHSDADVLTHALMDAILGALDLGDIGKHFPDADPAFKGISSMELLKRVVALMSEGGWEIGNADTVIVTEKPKIAPYADDIRKSLSSALVARPGVVSVKATTAEGLGFTGREEGIGAQAIVRLKRREE